MEKIEKIKKTLEKSKNYEHAITILNWDLETEAPEKAVEKRAKAISALEDLNYSLIVNDEFKELIYSIDTKELDDKDKRLLKVLKKDFEKLSKIPKEEYLKFSELQTISSQKWAEAKTTNNLGIFSSYLKELISYQKKFIKYIGYNDHPYNVLLNDYEEGLDINQADKFFEKIKTELSPFIKKINESNKEKIKDIKRRFNSKKYDIELQKKLSYEIAQILKYDFKAGVLKESEHPFTSGTGNKDTRITTHYYEEDLLSAIYSTIHEVGHAIYEQQVGDEYETNFLGGGVSMGIHESQSRLFENMLCKNDSFLPVLYKTINKYFNLDINLEEFKLLINDVESSLIRVEADELTYPVHILIRYELEKEIFSNLEKEEDIEKLAKKWDDMYEKYLGIRANRYKEGILQDVHWSQALFGYFPSYALGSAYSVQILEAMKKEFNVDKDLSEGNFENINNWLKENIHQYGSFINPKVLLEKATKEEFNPDYYVKYLKEKFSKIYNIEE